MNVSTTPQIARVRSRRSPAVSFEQVVAAATVLAERQGLEAISFRSLAAELGVSAMAVHRASGGIDVLLHSVVSRLVAPAIQDLEWPEAWQDVLITFATGLRDLLVHHPVVLQAHLRAPLSTPDGIVVTDRVLVSLESSGLAPDLAAYAYLSVHNFVTGHVAVQLGRGESERTHTIPATVRAHAWRAMAMAEYDELFTVGLDLLVTGIEAKVAAPGKPARAHNRRT